MKPPISLLTLIVAQLLTTSAMADPVAVHILLTPKEQMRFEFADGSKHFVLAVRREGKAEGSGVFAEANVTEFGWHDVNPPISGDPHGYLQITTQNGDVAVLRWTVKAVFTKGEGTPTLVDHGFWELVSGTGQFVNKRGVGSLVIKPAGGPNLFMLEGEVADKP